VNGDGNSEAFDSTSSSLLMRVKGRDPDAWQRLVKLYGPLVYRWAREAGLQDSDAADVMQEVFRAISAAIEDYRHDRPGDRFRGWVWTITRNKVRDHFRQRANQPEARGGTTAHIQIQQTPKLPSEEPEDTEATAITNLPRRALALIRGEFQEHTWQAFWRVAVAGDKPADVAEDLGMSVGAVYTAKSRVFRRVREELGELLD
jgi:RNA polymerase sigma-70 factor (ECF subfamily)